jgi:mono/diheme cytochrome c family protein
VRYYNAMAAAALFAFLVVWGFAGRPAAAQSSAPSVANGRMVFASALAPPPLELPAMITYVRQPTGKMPPVAEAAASDGQLADVFAYLQSLAPKTASAGEWKGDAENGKKLFAAYGCYECHGRQGAGASTGPRIGPPAITLAAVLRYVRAPTGQMPPYTAKVASDQDLADIYAYLKSFPTPPPAKDIPLLNP